MSSAASFYRKLALLSGVVNIIVVVLVLFVLHAAHVPPQPEGHVAVRAAPIECDKAHPAHPEVEIDNSIVSELKKLPVDQAEQPRQVPPAPAHRVLDSEPQPNRGQHAAPEQIAIQGNHNQKHEQEQEPEQEQPKQESAPPQDQHYHKGSRDAASVAALQRRFVDGIGDIVHSRGTHQKASFGEESPFIQAPLPAVVSSSAVVPDTRSAPSLPCPNLAPNNAFMQSRITAMWKEWEIAAAAYKVQHVTSSMRVLVFPAFIEKFGMNAKGSEPKSDHVHYVDLIAALSALGADVKFVTSLSEASQLFAHADDFDRLFMDYSGVNQMRTSHLRMFEVVKSKIGVLDAYGTEQKHNDRHGFGWCCLQLPSVRQYLTWMPPRLPDPTNTFLGFALPVEQSLLNVVKNPKQVYVWGKYKPFWELPGVYEYLQAFVNAGFELHATLGESLPKSLRVVDHGVLSHTEYLQLLATSAVYVGVGIPLIGSSALEALAYGCIVVNPIFEPPISYPEKPTDHRFGSQVELLEQVPEPHAYTVNINDPSAVDHLLGKLLAVGVQKPYIHPAYTMASMLQRVDLLMGPAYPNIVDANSVGGAAQAQEQAAPQHGAQPAAAASDVVHQANDHAASDAIKPGQGGVLRTNPLGPQQDPGKWREKWGHFAPVIDREHKIIMCTIAKSACTAWRKFLRRLKGFADWDTASEEVTHNYGGGHSGLTYLGDLTDEEADNIMQDPSYFKVAIVRNPVTRALSAWKDKFGGGGIHDWNAGWGQRSWPGFAKTSLTPTCNANEHWVAQSCFCGLRRWKYDYVAHMETDMDHLLDEMVARGHLSEAFVNTGWGKDGRERFLSSNIAGHKTDADKLVSEYYGPEHPGIFAHVVRVMAEDIERFEYQQDVEKMKQSLDS